MPAPEMLTTGRLLGKLWENLKGGLHYFRRSVPRPIDPRPYHPQPFPMRRLSSTTPLRSSLKQKLESSIHGSWATAFLSEFLGNSGHFLILKSLADIAIYGLINYLTDPTEYLLVGAMLIQTLYLSRSAPSRLLGNLIGVSLYTLIDFPVDGLGFFEAPSHAVFWGFSLAIALLQSTRYHWNPSLEHWIVPLESVVRMLMIVVFYAVVRVGDQVSQLAQLESLQTFLGDHAHLFLSGSLVLVGLLLGFQQLQIITQRRQLQGTAGVLRNLAEWGMGSHAVATAVVNPEGLAFQQCDRAILFMDIRGFTVWCEQTNTESIATALNCYYQQVEPAVSRYHPLRITFTGDEIMAIYTTPEQAVAAAQAMQAVAIDLLRPYNMGAGCAVHYGPVVEGLFGGDNVRTYTVIGDVVNTAKRLEGATPAGEISISDAVYQHFNQTIPVKQSRSLDLKGKAEPITSWLLA